MPRSAVALFALVAIFLASAVSGCAESQNAVKAAKDARYNTTFNNVWQVVQEEVHRRYANIHREDAVAGVIETDYRSVETMSSDLSQAGPTSYANIGQSSLSRPIPSNALPGTGNTHANENAIFRMTVQVLGPPWKVSIDGSAAKISPGMALPVPYRRGAADEPTWVQGRIDNLSVAIYERLKKFVVTGDKVKVEEKRADTSAWANLSDPTAIAVIESVRKAAGQRNAEGVRPFMAPDCRWDEGADPSADTAVAVWAADPGALQMLARALDGGCNPDEHSKDIVCPKAPSADTGRARFRQVAGTWKLVEFMKQ